MLFLLDYHLLVMNAWTSVCVYFPPQFDMNLLTTHFLYKAVLFMTLMFFNAKISIQNNFKVLDLLTVF